VFHETLQATPNSHPGLLRSLNSLGKSLVSRYERTGELGDLKEAIALLRQAVQAKPSPDGYLYIP
jgi:hypothetical protein